MAIPNFDDWDQQPEKQPPKFDDWVQGQQFAPLDNLKSFAAQNNLEVGSTTGGRHNRGSKHYTGNAIDIRNSGGFSDQQVRQLAQAASSTGLKLRDERTRPKGQKVWGGPHVHIETADEQIPKFDDWINSEQTPPSRAATQPPTPGQSAPPITQALDALTQSTNRATRKLMRRAEQQPNRLFQQLGQQRTIDEQQRTQQQQAENEARTELQSERLLPNYPGIPSGRGVLKLISDPVGKFGEMLKSDDQIVQERAQQKLHQQQVAQEPEVTSIRKEYGAMPAAERAIVAPLARGGAGLLNVAGGLAELGGMLPKGYVPPLDELSKWAKKRSEIIEAGSINAPLREQQNLSSLVTGKPELEEVERGIPEKIATGIADLGVGVGSVLLLKKATNLSFPTLLGLEAALKASDKPVTEQVAAAAQGALLGKALDSHLSKAANAALFGIPTAAQTGYEVSQGRMSPLDAAIQTGIQAGAGALLSSEREPSSLERGLAREPVRERVEPDAGIAAKLRTETPRDSLRERMRQRNAPVATPPETPASEPKSTTLREMPPLGDRPQPKHSESIIYRGGNNPTESIIERGRGVIATYSIDPDTHLPLKVLDAEGKEHFVKRSDLTGRGNQRMVPLREESPAEALPPAQPPEPATPKEEVRPPSTSVTKPVTETAVKNAAMKADRAARNLPELAQAEPRKATEVHQRALDANARDPRSPDRLVQQALSSDKNFTDVETAQLRLRAQEIKNREQDLFKEIDSATDPQVIRDKRVELDSLTDEFDRLSQATKKAGTEWGRAGVARQQAIDQDFSLVSMKARLKAAKGEQLTEAENRQVEDLYRRNAELESKLAEANDKLAQRRLQNEIDRTSRRARRAQTKQSLDDEFAQLKQQFAQARAEVRNVQPSGLAAFDPEGKLTKLIGKMARNRVQAGVTDAAQLVDDIHAVIAEHLPDISKREVRDAISGYSIGPKSRRSELQQQIDSLKSELKSVSKEEDIVAGRRSPAHEGPQRVYQRDQARQHAIQKQIADLESQMRSGDFRDKPPREPARYTKETYELQKQLDEVRLEYERMKYRATASPSTRLGHEAVKVVNALKTLKSIGDVSAMLRQGGFYGISHPVEGLLKPTREMIKSFTDMGYRNVEAAIKADPAYDTLKQAGVEFTGVERSNPHLSVREEGFFGKEYLQYIPGVKQVVNFSERTFVSFLDAQRLLIGKQMIEGLPESARNNPQELKAIAKLINAGTGRGNLGKRGNQAAPLLNLAIFSPRLLVSRIQLLNNMISPRKLATMPPGARSRMVKDNVKFVGATMAALGLAKAAGMSVNLNPNDADFLKIRAGNTTYDTLTGLQQPLRYLINMGRAIEADVTGNEMYSGRSKAELSGRFARSKLSPAAGIGLDYILGKDYMGKPFSLKNEAKEAVMPLPAKDVIEGMQNEGLWGGVKALPTFTGIGVSNYPYKPYVNKKVQRLGLESDVREGRKSAYELNEMVERGEITGAQRKQILNDAKVSEKQARFNNSPAATALDRFERMDAAAQEDVRDIMEKKAYNLLHSDTLTDAQKEQFKERLDKLGITPQAPDKKSSSSFKDLFKQRTASPF